MIRNLLALVGLAFVLFVVIGYPMKWFTFSREEGKLTINIFTDKVEEGLKNIQNKAVELGKDLGKALTKPDAETPKSESTSFGGLFTPTVAQPTGSPPASLPMPR